MLDVTLLYYSASVENPAFEARVRANILAHKGDLPIVAVTQQPLYPDAEYAEEEHGTRRAEGAFGTNLWVAAPGASYHNEFRQIQIGLQAIATPYVLTAEADCLLPKAYFQFRPPELGHVYRYDNVWVVFAESTPYYFFKGRSDGMQMVDRLDWLARLDSIFTGKPFWCLGADEERLRAQFYGRMEDAWSGEPAITFKTGHALRAGTRHERFHWRFLAPWGDAADLIARMQP